MQQIFVAVLLVLVGAHALSSEETGREYLIDAYFSENSVRDLPNREEAKAMFKVVNHQNSNVCAAYFVANSEGRNLVATARHCFDFQLRKACREQNFDLIHEATKKVAICKQVVVENIKFDMAIIEVEFEQSLPENSKNSFRLANFRTRSSSMLSTLGYPRDPQRNSQFTRTRNCWVSEKPTSVNQLARRNLSPEDRQSMMSAYMSLNKDMLQGLAGLNKSRGYHNCTTYAGNSGGPVTLECSDVAIGTPMEYFPQFGNQQSSQFKQDLPVAYEETYNFVRANRDQLAQAGVIFANQQPAPCDTSVEI